MLVKGRRRRSLYSLVMGISTVNCGNQYGDSSSTLKTEPPYDPALLVLSTSPRESESAQCKDTCIAVFPMSKLWHPSRYLSNIYIDTFLPSPLPFKENTHERDRDRNDIPFSFKKTKLCHFQENGNKLSDSER